MPSSILSLLDVKERLRSWRRERCHPSDPMPAYLQEQIQQLLSKHSVTHLAHALCLTPAFLRNLAQGQSFHHTAQHTRSHTASVIQEAEIDFIAVSPPQPKQNKQCSASAHHPCQTAQTTHHATSHTMFGDTTGTITRTDGTTLTFQTTNPKAIIAAFLCLT